MAYSDQELLLKNLKRAYRASRIPIKEIKQILRDGHHKRKKRSSTQQIKLLKKQVQTLARQVKSLAKRTQGRRPRDRMR